MLHSPVPLIPPAAASGKEDFQLQRKNKQKRPLKKQVKSGIFPVVKQGPSSQFAERAACEQQLVCWPLVPVTDDQSGNMRTGTTAVPHLAKVTSQCVKHSKRRSGSSSAGRWLSFYVKRGDGVLADGASGFSGHVRYPRAKGTVASCY